jgi:NUMOD1 domain
MRARHLERVWGDNVKVTDTSTGEIISYKSIRTAAKAMSCSQNTIAKYNKSGNLYKSRYLIQVISNPRSSPLV